MDNFHQPGVDEEARPQQCVAPNNVVEKVPVRSCRECHRKTQGLQFVDRAVKQSTETCSALEFFATAQSCR